MNLATLVDNAAYGKGILAEHGFSVLIEAGGCALPRSRETPCPTYLISRRAWAIP